MKFLLLQSWQFTCTADSSSCCGNSVESKLTESMYGNPCIQGGVLYIFCILNTEKKVNGVYICRRILGSIIWPDKRVELKNTERQRKALMGNHQDVHLCGGKRPNHGRNRLLETRQRGTCSWSLCLLCYSLQNGNHMSSFTLVSCTKVYNLLLLQKNWSRMPWATSPNDSNFPVPHDGIKIKKTKLKQNRKQLPDW